MALQVQPQWDISSSAFSIGDRLWGLVKAATVDDVQPAAVYAAEAIGSHLAVDPYLIGKAIDVLGGDKSYRLDAIKLQLGLSSGGISNQLRLSTPAIQTFLLVTALRLHLPSEEIGNLFYELLIETGTIKSAPVSARQLTSLVDSIEGHCIDLQQRENISTNVIAPVLESIALSETRTNAFFEAMAPDKGARILLAAFQAIKDEEIRHLNIRGSESGLWLISILCWLCPGDVEVLNEQKLRLFGDQIKNAKISVVLNRQEKWRLEYWYRISEISSIIEIEESRTYNRRSDPSLIPQSMTYNMLRFDSTMECNEDGVETIGNLCFGMIQAVMSKGLLIKDTDNTFPAQSIHFREICTESFQNNFDFALQDYGWPISSIDRICASSVASYIASHPNEFSLGQWHTFFTALDQEMDGGLLRYDRFKKGDFFTDAICLTEHILLRATHQKTFDFEFRLSDLPGYKYNHLNILIPLLGNGRGLSASYFFRHSLTCQHTRLVLPDAAEDLTEPPRVLAACDRGYVSYCRGLQEVPQSPAQAFEIIVQPGSLKWRDVRHRFLYEAGGMTMMTLNTLPKFGRYKVSTNLDSLRLYNSSKLQFSVGERSEQTGYEYRDMNGIELQISGPSTGDHIAMLSYALINWALAARAKRTGKSKEDQVAECIKTGITELKLKAPGVEGLDDLGGHTDFGDDFQAVASYSGDEWADFYRFGTVDVNKLNCVIQGTASIYECICNAVQIYGKKWIIMANP